MPKVSTQKTQKKYRHNIFGQNPKIRAFSSQPIFFIPFFQNYFQIFKNGHFCLFKNVQFSKSQITFGKNTSKYIGFKKEILYFEDLKNATKTRCFCFWKDSMDSRDQCVRLRYHQNRKSNQTNHYQHLHRKMILEQAAMCAPR